MSITPLLDIVFILLIFFIVTATFLREKGLDFYTPDDCYDCNADPPPALLLAIQENGFVRVNNVRVIDPSSVKPVVQEFIAREPYGFILVSAAPDSETGMTVNVMDQAIDGGVSPYRIAFALQKTL